MQNKVNDPALICKLNEVGSLVAWKRERSFFSGQRDTNWPKNSSQVLCSWKSTSAVIQVCFSHVGPQMWRLKAVSHNPAWQWCHKQQVPWIHLQPRERGGKRPLKSLTHHKRGERGEDDEVWVIRQFFHSIKGDYAKEKQVWMSLLAMVTVSWPLAENNVTEMCDNNPCFVMCQWYVWGDSSTEKMASPVPSWAASADLQAKPNTEWIMMCQQPPAPGFRL